MRMFIYSTEMFVYLAESRLLQEPSQLIRLFRGIGCSLPLLSLVPLEP